MQTTAVAGHTDHGLHQAQDFQCGYESPDRLTVEFVHSGAFVPWAASLLQSEPRLPNQGSGMARAGAEFNSVD